MTEAVVFEQHFSVRWSDLDANRHVRNTVYSEFATHTRFRMLEAHGFTQERFGALGIGPVMFREDIRYRRELLLGDEVVVNVLITGLSEDGSRWRVRQEVIRGRTEECAALVIDGAWIDLEERRLVTPPDDLLQLFRRLPRAGNFEGLRSVIRGSG